MIEIGIASTLSFKTYTANQPWHDFRKCLLNFDWLENILRSKELFVYLDSDLYLVSKRWFRPHELVYRGLLLDVTCKIFVDQESGEWLISSHPKKNKTIFLIARTPWEPLDPNASPCMETTLIENWLLLDMQWCKKASHMTDHLLALWVFSRQLPNMPTNCLLTVCYCKLHTFDIF